VAVAVHLLDPAVSATPIAPVESEAKETEVKEEPQSNQDVVTNVSQILDDLRRGPLLGHIYRLGFRHFNRWHQPPLLQK
jgi:hypothetical protein